MAVKNGVTHYAKGVAYVPVYFPEGKVCCASCMVFCRYEEAFRGAAWQYPNMFSAQIMYSDD